MDVFEQFKSVSGLGLGTPVLLLVKYQKEKQLLVEHRQAFIRAQNKSRFGSLLLPLRAQTWSGGFAAAMTLSPMMDPDRGLWRVNGAEVRGVAVRDEITVIAFVNGLGIYSTGSGRWLQTIEDPQFKNLHSVMFSPGDPQRVLISNAGLDSILELDLSAQRVTWSWHAWSHGYGINPFGVHLLADLADFPGKSEDRLLTHAEVKERMREEKRGIPTGERWFVHVACDNVAHPLGLEKWMKGAEPNWAGYDGQSDKILATLFVANVAVQIDRKTGVAREVCGGLSRPHGMVPFRDGYLISDTRKGRVLLLDAGFQVRQIYDFSTMPCSSAMADGDGEWLQFSTPIGDGTLLATVDSRRSVIFVWNPDRLVYTAYPFPEHWSVHGVLDFPF